MKRSGLAVGLVALALIAGACVLVPPWLARDPLDIDTSRILHAPTWEHPFGTDSLGRDVLARVLVGGRASLGAGVTAALLALALGAILGAIAGTEGGVADGVLARVADIVLAFPALVGTIALLGLLEARASALPSPVRVGAVIGVFYAPSLFRFVRAEAQRLRTLDLATAARAIGCPRHRVVLLHLLPAAIAPALVPLAFAASGAVLVEAGLGFLGLGIDPPAPSWGNVLREARDYVRTAWWLTAFPGAFLYATTLCCHIVAEGARERLATRAVPQRAG